MDLVQLSARIFDGANESLIELSSVSLSLSESWTELSLLEWLPATHSRKCGQASDPVDHYGRHISEIWFKMVRERLRLAATDMFTRKKLCVRFLNWVRPSIQSRIKARACRSCCRIFVPFLALKALHSMGECSDAVDGLESVHSNSLVGLRDLTCSETFSATTSISHCIKTDRLFENVPCTSFIHRLFYLSLQSKPA